MQRTYLTAAALLVGGLVGWPSGALAQDAPLVFRVPVTGVVEMGLAPFIERAIREAESAGVSVVVLDIDTPGGRVDSAERIADAISDSGVPVYALVNRRAFSAGALIALATRGIYMRPGSVLGAVTPVDGSGTKASEKIVSAMRSEMRALAEARGLDPAIAEAMVDESLAVPNVVDAGRLLTLTTEEAVRVGYASETDNFSSLLDDLGFAGAEVTDFNVNWAERFVRFFSNPVVAPFLLSLGFLGLIIEIKTATFGLAGLAGALSLSLFFGSHLILGLAGWEDLLLVGAGGLVRRSRSASDPRFRPLWRFGHRRHRRRHLHESARQSSLGAGLQPGGGACSSRHWCSCWSRDGLSCGICPRARGCFGRVSSSARGPTGPSDTSPPKRGATSSAPRVSPRQIFGPRVWVSSVTNVSISCPSRSGSRRARPSAS